MKIVAKITLQDAKESHKPGSVIEMDDATAKTLIARNFAEEYVEDAVIVKPVVLPIVPPAPAGESVKPSGLVGSNIEIPGVVGTFKVDSVDEDETLNLSDAGDTSEVDNLEDGEEDGDEDEEAPEVPAEAPVEKPAPIAKAVAPKPTNKKR